jgi:anti-sigma factor RsiW
LQIMQCTRYREAIQELVDGTLGPIRRAELELHLDQCDDCRALAVDLQAIHDTAASLEPLTPPGAVWMQIAGRLRQEGRVSSPARVPTTSRHRAVLLAMAAALVLTIGGSIVLLLPQFRAARDERPQAATSAAADTGNAAGDNSVQSVEAEFRLAEQHYQNAIDKLEQAAKLDQAAKSGDIDPQTAATLQKNLQGLDQAIAESRVGLRSEPQSAVARDSLFDALKRKVSLLQDTIALMNEMRKGNPAGAAQLVEGLNKS